MGVEGEDRREPGCGLRKLGGVETSRGDQVMNNLYGSYKASLIYSQQIKFNRKMAMKIGVQGTYIHTRIKWNELLWSDMINPYSGFYNYILHLQH